VRLILRSDVAAPILGDGFAAPEGYV